MWNQISVLSEDEIFNDTFSVNTLVRIDNSDPSVVSVWTQFLNELYNQYGLSRKISFKLISTVFNGIYLFYLFESLDYSIRLIMIQNWWPHSVTSTLPLPLIRRCICWKKIWLLGEASKQRSLHSHTTSTVWQSHQMVRWLCAVYLMEVLLDCTCPA